MADNRERKPDILGPLTGAEMIHNQIIDMFTHAEQSSLKIFEAGSESTLEREGYLVQRLDIGGASGEDTLMIMGIDGCVHCIEGCIFRYDEYSDASGLGRDADGQPAQLMRVDPTAELVKRNLSVFYDVDDEGKADDGLGFHNGLVVEYDVRTGFSAAFWKGQDPDIAQDPSVWITPSKNDIEYFRAVLHHAHTLVFER